MVCKVGLEKLDLHGVQPIVENTWFGCSARVPGRAAHLKNHGLTQNTDLMHRFNMSKSLKHPEKNTVYWNTLAHHRIGSGDPALHIYLYIYNYIII